MEIHKNSPVSNSGLVIFGPFLGSDLKKHEIPKELRDLDHDFVVIASKKMEKIALNACHEATSSLSSAQSTGSQLGLFHASALCQTAINLLQVLCSLSGDSRFTSLLYRFHRIKEIAAKSTADHSKSEDLSPEEKLDLALEEVGALTNTGARM